MTRAKDEIVLEVDDVAVAFGGIQALRGASFTVRRGSITGLIGPNGAGKTTLFDVITGFTRPDRGQVRHEDRRVDGLPTHMIARRGIGRTFQLIRLMPGLSAIENLMVAQPNPAGESLAGSLTGAWRGADAENRAACRRLIEEVEMAHRSDVLAGDLSYGQQKLVEIARTLSLDADLILLDEPMAGVNPVMRNRILETIHRLHESGKTFLIVEHDLQMIMTHCDEVVVLDQGVCIAQGAPEIVSKDPKVIEAYMGTKRRGEGAEEAEEAEEAES